MDSSEPWSSCVQWYRDGKYDHAIRSITQVLESQFSKWILEAQHLEAENSASSAKADMWWLPGGVQVDAQAIPLGWCGLVINHQDTASKSGPWFLLRARCFAGLRETQQACCDAQSSLACDPNNDEARLLYAEMMEQDENFRKALALCQMLVHSSTESVRDRARNMLARLTRQSNGVPGRLETKQSSLTNISDANMLTVQKHQTYRFQIRSPGLRRVIAINVPFGLCLRITNEFGLFQTRDFESLCSRYDQHVPGTSCFDSNNRGCLLNVDVILMDHFTGQASAFYEFAEPSMAAACFGSQSSMSQLEASRETLDLTLMIQQRSEHQAEVSESILRIVVSARQPVSARPVLSASSMPFLIAHCSDGPKVRNVSSGKLFNNLLFYESISPICCRPIEVVVNSATKQLLVAEAQGDLGIGGKIWDSSFALINFFLRNREMLAGEPHRCLELGSGTGISGLALCLQCETDIIMTDLEEVVSLIQINISLNEHLFPHSRHAGVEGRTLRWRILADWQSSDLARQELEVVHGLGYNSIVMADVVYDPELYHPLVDTLRMLTMPPRHQIPAFMAYTPRHPQAHEFFDLMGKYFSKQLVEQQGTAGIFRFEFLP